MTISLAMSNFQNAIVSKQHKQRIIELSHFVHIPKGNFMQSIIYRSFLESCLSPEKIVNFPCLYNVIYKIEGTPVSLLYLNKSFQHIHNCHSVRYLDSKEIMFRKYIIVIAI